MNQTSCSTIWENCKSLIRELLDERQFDLWFKKINAVSVDHEKKILTLSVPSDYFREYLEATFGTALNHSLKKVMGEGVSLEYMIEPVKSKEKMIVSGTHVSSVRRSGMEAVNVSSAKDGNPAPMIYPGLKKLTIDSRLNNNYCFQNYVVGECNMLGVRVGKDIAHSPGGVANPLYVYGGPGLGKTHLVHAIGLEIQERHPNLSVLYVTGNEFKTQYMQNVGIKNKLTDFIAFYMRIDVLIVDDIQDMIGQGTQQAFFNIFNYLRDNGKQLIFTSDRSLAELENFEERLQTRLKWGVSVHLEKPQYQTRFEAIKMKCRIEGINLQEDILSYLATNINTNFRELQCVLLSLVAHATHKSTDVTIDLANKIIRQIVKENTTVLTQEMIQTAVCKYYNISKEDLLSRSRTRQIVQARQIAMYFCRQKLNSPLATIGKFFGGKDHSTVLHACNTILNLMSVDKEVKDNIIEIEQMLVSQ